MPFHSGFRAPAAAAAARQTATKGVDVSVTSKKEFNTDNGTNPPAFAQALVDRTRQVTGVQKAEGGVFDNGTIVGNNGKKVNGSGGAPNFITNPRQAPFDPFRYVSGHAPAASNPAAAMTRPDSGMRRRNSWKASRYDASVG